MAKLISLEWERCPDGVRIVRESPVPVGDAGSLLAAADQRLVATRAGTMKQVVPSAVGFLIYPDDEYFEYASDRRTPVSVEVGGGMQSVALQFAEASSHDSLELFIKKYGLPFLNTPKRVSVGRVDTAQKVVATIAGEYRAGRASQATDILDAFVAEFAPEAAVFPKVHVGSRSIDIGLRPNTMLGYMFLELAILIGGGAHVASCAHCRTPYITGAHTGRRSTSIYCSNRCRVAAQRERAKEEMGSATPAS